MTVLLDTIKLLRPLNLLLGVISLIVTAFLVDQTTVTQLLFLTIGVVITFMGGANALNDLLDFNVDKVNRPQRPLPAGKLSKKTVLIMVCILFSMGFVFSIQLNALARNLALFIIFPTLLLYTPVFKKIPLMGNIIIGLILGVVFLFGEAALAGEIKKMWVPALLAFGLTWIREFVKDIQDLSGDKGGNVKTFPVKYGIPTSLQLIYILIISLCFLAVIPFVIQLYGKWYFLTLILSVEIPLIYCIFFLRKNPTSSGCVHVSKILKFTTITGLGVILCTKF